MFQGHLSRLSPKQVIHGRFGKERQAQKKARAPGSFLQSEPIVENRASAQTWNRFEMRMLCCHPSLHLSGHPITAHSANKQ